MSIQNKVISEEEAKEISMFSDIRMIREMPSWARAFIKELKMAREASFHYYELSIAWKIAVYQILSDTPEHYILRDRIVSERNLIIKECEQWLTPSERRNRNKIVEDLAKKIDKIKKLTKSSLDKKRKRGRPKGR